MAGAEDVGDVEDGLMLVVAGTTGMDITGLETTKLLELEDGFGGALDAEETTGVVVGAGIGEEDTADDETTALLETGGMTEETTGLDVELGVERGVELETGTETELEIGTEVDELGLIMLLEEDIIVATGGTTTDVLGLTMLLEAGTEGMTGILEDGETLATELLIITLELGFGTEEEGTIGAELVDEEQGVVV